jgi:tripartite-type tricarboxylate transporter receptor subunit TctC
LKEIGWPGVVSTNWFLLAAPAGLPPAIAERLAEAVRVTLAEPAVRERLDAAGVVSLGAMPPPAIAAFVAEEAARWAPVVRASGAAAG